MCTQMRRDIQINANELCERRELKILTLAIRNP